METHKHAKIVNAFKSIADDIQSEFQLIRGCLNVLERQINDISSPPKPTQQHVIEDPKPHVGNPYFRNIRSAVDYYSSRDNRYLQLSELALDYGTSVAELLELGGLNITNVKKFKRGVFPQRHVIQAIIDMKPHFHECHKILSHMPDNVSHSRVFTAALAQFIQSIPHDQIPKLDDALTKNVHLLRHQTSRQGFVHMISDIYFYGGSDE